MPPFDWKEFLVLAQSLSNNRDEASLRSAVSRAYYCAYNHAVAKAEVNGYSTKGDATGGSHDLLWQLYGRNDDETCRKIFLLGPRMKRRRTNADYKPFFFQPSKEAQEAITDAEICLDLLAQLAQGLPANEPRKWSF